MRRRLTYANITATLALVFAMSGGAYAASKYLITSTKQISPKVLKKLKGNTGPTGPTGPAGPTGATGVTGLTGAQGKEGKEGLLGKEGKEGKVGPPGPTNLSKLKEVRGARAVTTEIAPGEFGAFSVAVCPAGSHAISGGAEVEGKEFIEQGSEREPEAFGPGEAWGAYAFYAKLEGHVEAIAYCATEGSAVEASPVSPAQERSLAAAWTRLIRQQRSERTR